MQCVCLSTCTHTSSLPAHWFYAVMLCISTGIRYLTAALVLLLSTDTRMEARCEGQLCSLRASIVFCTRASLAEESSQQCWRQHCFHPKMARQVVSRILEVEAHNGTSNGSASHCCTSICQRHDGLLRCIDTHSWVMFGTNCIAEVQSHLLDCMTALFNHPTLDRQRQNPAEKNPSSSQDQEFTRCVVLFCRSLLLPGARMKPQKHKQRAAAQQTVCSCGLISMVHSSRRNILHQPGLLRRGQR